MKLEQRTNVPENNGSNLETRREAEETEKKIRFLTQIRKLLGSRSKAVIITIALLLIAAVGAGDYLTGEHFGFFVFYIIPIAFVAWFVNEITGALVALVCAVVWFLADLFAGGGYANTGYAVWDSLIQLGFFILIIVLIYRLRKALIKEVHLSRTDTLTGIANRRHFYELLDGEIRRERRYAHPLTVAYLDLDNFKEVNDTYGHETGDELLRMTADFIQHDIRETDTIARLGGDEFAILLPETSAAGGYAAVQKIQELFHRKMGERDWPVTMSVGIVTFLSPPQSVGEVLQKADELMYSVKNSGKDGVHRAVIGEAGEKPATVSTS